MEILNGMELARATRRFPQAGAALAAWRTVVESANWRSIVDVGQSYPSADGVVLGRGRHKQVVTVFNIGGNDFRLLTRISYERQLVQVEGVLTHAEYSKDSWKKRYE